MKKLILTLILILNIFIVKSQCTYTNTMPSTVLAGKNICFTQDITITHGSIVNYGTITINDGVKVTFNGALQNYGSGKFKLMGCDAKINVTTFGGVWQNIDIERYCGSGSCNDVSINSGGPVDLGYFKTAGSASYVDVDCQEPLPVELISYVCNNKEILWSTGSEINSDYFTILYSDNGMNFTPVTNITAQGNSSEVINYSHPITNKGYYKLTQTDYDGMSEEFNVKFCGPDNDKVTLVASYDVLGQVIQDSYRGIVIELYSDGSTKRIYKK